MKDLRWRVESLWFRVSGFRVTAPPPPRTLDIGLLLDPREKLFLMSEVPLYLRHSSRCENNSFAVMRNSSEEGSY